MNIKRMRNLAIEIFKTFNNFNLSFMKEIFTTKTDARIRPNGIAVKSRNTATYGDKSLTTLGPKICNSFTEKISERYLIYLTYSDLIFLTFSCFSVL